MRRGGADQASCRRGFTSKALNYSSRARIGYVVLWSPSARASQSVDGGVTLRNTSLFEKSTQKKQRSQACLRPTLSSPKGCAHSRCPLRAHRSHTRPTPRPKVGRKGELRTASSQACLTAIQGKQATEATKAWPSGCSGPSKALASSVDVGCTTV